MPLTRKAASRPAPWLSAFILLGLFACKGPVSGQESAPSASPAEAQVLVSQIKIRDLTEEKVRGGFRLPKLRTVLTEGLPTGSLLRFERPAAGPTPETNGGNRLHVAVLHGLVSKDGHSIHEPEEGARLTAGVQLHLALISPREPARVLQAERIGEEALTSGDKAAVHDATAALLRRLTRSAIRALDQRVTIHQGGEAAALAGLEARDAAVQAYAIEQVGERGYERAIPQLIEIIEGEDPKLRLRAIGSLGLLGASTATAKLAALAGGNERPREIAAAIQALADINTPEARRYLKSVGATSLFEDVRHLVDEALKR